MLLASEVPSDLKAQWSAIEEVDQALESAIQSDDNDQVQILATHRHQQIVALFSDFPADADNAEMRASMLEHLQQRNDLLQSLARGKLDSTARSSQQAQNNQRAMRAYNAHSS